MTKLSERVPDPNYGQSFKEWRARLRGWLKELAESVEFIDRRDRLAYRSLREQLSEPDQKEKVKYEPQTYDEAIALIKGWKRCVASDYFVHWETLTGDWVLIGRDVAVDDQSTYDACIVSWEKDKWPDLWKEMVKDGCKGHLYLYKNRWTLNLPGRYEDSTPGRVVCQAYLCFKNHRDWAERLSK